MTDGNVYFLIGDEESVKSRIEEIRTDAGKEVASVPVLSYYASELDLEDFRKKIQNPSLFSENQFIVVHNAELLDRKIREKFFSLLDDVSEGTILIVEGRSLRKPFPEKFDIETLGKQEEPGEKKLYGIFRKRNVRHSEIADVVSSFLKEYPYKQVFVISAFEQYVQRLLISGEISEKTFARKVEYLHDIDYKIKIGRIDSRPGWEVLLFRLLDFGR